MMNTYVAVVVGVLAGLPLCYGQVSQPSDDPKESKAMAQRLIADVTHNRPVQWRELMGRSDVLTHLRSMTCSLNVDQNKQVLEAVLNIGMQESQRRWVLSSAVTRYLVEVTCSAGDGEIREYAGELLVKYVPSRYLAVHAGDLLKATEKDKVRNALLLGKTGAEEAKLLLQKGGRLWVANEGAARAALARLGDTAVSKSCVDAYTNERDPKKKASLAKVLGYIGDAACTVSLARDMRSPLTYDAAGVLKPLRLDIVEALSEVYPDESVFRNHNIQGNKEIDEWYAAIERKCNLISVNG